ncbi:MAG: formyltetrahydrofolate deformylase [Acidimicrobiales bacterium]
MTVLLLSCPDAPGLVAATASLIHERGGNIAHADQHADERHGLFLQRIEFDFGTDADHERFRAEFAELAQSLGMTWEMVEPDHRARLAILVSKEGHCLLDLLARIRLEELNAEVPVVISNHEDHREITERFGVPFLHLPVDPDDKAAQQAALLDALEAADVDLVVLARYMQILPPSIIDRFPRRIINIHHSFLPAFVGAKPYHQAYDRGVKIIGATAHYATAELDQGPIICQEVTPVSHRDSPERLIRQGGDLEQTVLARAVRLHVERRVLAYANRTVVFD